MAIWVCRAGKKSVYVADFLKFRRVYCTWDGFNYDLNLYMEKNELKQKIRTDNTEASQTAINTWAAQLIIFRDKMNIGDIILTPNESSKSYNIGILQGKYCYNKEAGEHFNHSHEVRWIDKTIAREAFPQNVIYSLGAYRTIFKLKYEDAFFEVCNKEGIKF